jgi:hypothetical protein
VGHPTSRVVLRPVQGEAEPLVRGSFEDLQELEHNQAKHDQQVAAQKDQREFGGLGHFYSGHVTPHVLARMTRPFIISL